MKTLRAMLTSLAFSVVLLGSSDVFAQGIPPPQGASGNPFQYVELTGKATIAAPTTASTGKARIFYDTTKGKLQLSRESGAWADLGGGVTSITGTANQITASASTGDVTLSLAPPLLLPSGSGAAPSYSFSSDAATGMYYSATHNLSFSVNGNESLRVLGASQDVAVVNHLVFGISSAATKLLGTTDGQLLLQNNAGTGFTSLQFGGTTSSFPEIKRNAAAINFRLADDSGDAAITAGAATLAATTVTTLGMGGTLTVGANTLALASATVSGTPTWSSSQAITLSTAAQPNITSTGTLAGLTMTGTLSMSSTPVISGSPACTLGATTVTTLGTGGNVTLAAGNHLVLATSGAGTQIGTGTTQLLGFYGATAVAQTSGSTDVLAGLVTIGLRAASSNPPLNLGSGALTAGASSLGTITLTASSALNFATGGTYAAGATSEIYFPTDTGGFITAGKPAGTASGQALTLTGGLATTTGAGGLCSAVGGTAAGSNQGAGGFTADSGGSTGTAAGALLFKVPATTGTGSGANASATVLTINNVGLVYLGLQNVTDVGAISLTASKGGSTSGSGGGFTAVAGAAGTAGGACGIVTVTAGANAVASGSTAGGAVNVTGGACTGTTSTGAGGAITCAGGLGGTSSGAGGAGSFKGGNANGTSSAGGSALLGAGLGADSTGNFSHGATISVAGGLANSTGGAVTISGGANAGSSVDAAGGAVSISGGSTTAGTTGNNAGGSIIIKTGAPSGTGTANVQVQTGFTTASGTGAQTLGDRLLIPGHSVTMSNTTATATGIAVLNVPTSTSGGGAIVIYEVVASDGSNINTATGQFTVSCSNKAGTVTATASALVGEAQNDNSGTLTAGTISTTIASQAVTIKIAPAWGTIVPTSVVCNVTLIPFGNGVTVTAQ